MIYPINFSVKNQNLITVFKQNTTLNQASWNSLNFTTPFTWDGTSNILVEISYANDETGTADNTVKSSSTSFISGIQSSGNDSYLSFNGPDFVKFENAAQDFSSIDEQITVSFWVNGDPEKQPQNDHTFEFADAQNRRVVSVHLPWSGTH